MANNEHVNEVIYGNETLISLKNDTVTPQTLARGVTAHDRSGAPIEGVMDVGPDPDEVYMTTDTAEINLADGDYFPFYDTSASAKRKTLWSNIIAKIKAALGSAAVKDVPTSGNASSSQVVMGNDSRLTDSRPASDVSAWAKASSKPSYTASEVGAIATTAKGANGGVAELDENGKVPTSQLPTDANNAVTQTISSTTNADYRVLMSATADDTTRTEGARKDTDFKYNPSTNTLYAKNVKGTSYNDLITGSGTAAQDKGEGQTNRYVPAKWTFNTGRAATDGDIVTIKIPVAGHTYGVYLSVDNGSNYKPIAINGTTRLSTQYAVDTYIQLMYETGASVASIYPLNGGDATTTVTGGAWRVINYRDSNDNTVPSAYCDTAAGTAAKVASCTQYTLTNKTYLHVLMRYANSYDGKITLNVNGKGAKDIYINGTVSSSSNKTLPAGTYLVYYADSKFYFRTDGKLTADITGNAGTVNGHSVEKDVPSDAVFTDTTYTPQKLGFGYGTCDTAAATAAKTATLSSYELVKNGYVSVKFTYAVPASATLSINSKTAKPIYYHGSAITAGIINAGDMATFVYDGTNYNLVGVDNVSSQIEALTNQVAKCECLVLSTGNTQVNALPYSFTNAAIDDDMVCINAVLSNPSAQTGDWTVTTSNGTAQITGTISGSTTITLYMMKSR